MAVIDGVNLQTKINQPTTRLSDINVVVNNNSVADSHDSVDISNEAKEKLATEIASRLHQGGDTTALSGKDDAKTIEEKIEELKDKIRELMQKIARLATKGDEESLEKVKALEIELAMLNAQLLELMKQQLEDKP